MARKIPDYIVDNAVRLKLAVINEATDKLLKAHKELMKHAKAKTLTAEGQKTLRNVIAAKNKLDKLWDSLVPRLSDFFTRK